MYIIILNEGAMKDTKQNENMDIHAIYFITKPTKIKHEILSKYLEKLYYLSRVVK